MHGEYLVVNVGLQYGLPRNRQLGANQHGQQAANQEEHKTRAHEAQANGGVVNNGQRLQAPGVTPYLLKALVQQLRIVQGGGTVAGLFVIDCVGCTHRPSVSSQAAMSGRCSGTNSL